MANVFGLRFCNYFFFRNRIVNWASRISLRSVYSGTVEGPPTHLFYVLSSLGRLTATIRPVQSTSQRTLINESRTVCRCHWTVKQLAIAHFHLQLWTHYGNISDINKEYRQRQNRLRFLFFLYDTSTKIRRNRQLLTLYDWCVCALITAGSQSESRIGQFVVTQLIEVLRQKVSHVPISTRFLRSVKIRCKVPWPTPHILTNFPPKISFSLFLLIWGEKH